MTFLLRLTTEAQLEETEAYNYYEDIREGLGDELLSELKEGYKRISENPFYYSYLGKSKLLRDLKINKFPFVLIYLVVDNSITIVSVRNTYRRPFIYGQL